MADPTVLVVGIPLTKSNEKLMKGKYEVSLDCPPSKICYFGAGYENLTKWHPEAIIGVQIADTWNDAINLDTKQVQSKILQARKTVESKLGVSGNLWMIGQQT